jgi:hypothetical protein
MGENMVVSGWLNLVVHTREGLVTIGWPDHLKGTTRASLTARVVCVHHKLGAF